jgi:deoxyadenosine/deoxycytidine kinase
MIVIDGNIGSGKSTLLALLGKKYKVLMETFVFSPDNPDTILPKFYADPAKYAMAVQLKVLMSHVDIVERSPLSCLRVFGRLLAEDGLINEEEQTICELLNERYGWMPKVVFYISTDPEICYQRINNRGRDYEKEIKLSYLQQLHDKYEDLYNNPIDGCKVIILNGNSSIDELYNQVEWVIPNLLNQIFLSVHE